MLERTILFTAISMGLMLAGLGIALLFKLFKDPL